MQAERKVRKGFLTEDGGCGDKVSIDQHTGGMEVEWKAFSCERWESRPSSEA